MHFVTSKQRFRPECESMDPVKDSFSKVLERAGLADGDSLTRTELAELHRIYLEAMRRGLPTRVGSESARRRDA